MAAPPTTICEEAEINYRVYNAIRGHAGRTAADSYGDVTLKTKAAAVRKLPSFELDKLRAIALNSQQTHDVESQPPQQPEMQARR